VGWLGDILPPKGWLAVGMPPADVLVVAWLNTGMSMPSQSRTVGHGLQWRRSERRTHVLGGARGRSAQAVHTATALAAGSQHQLGSLRIPASTTGYGQLLGWAQQFPQRRWAIENARGLGCHLTQWLLAQGETVQDVRTTATARVRELSRGRGRKTDALDAAAAAGIAAMQGDAEPLKPEDATMVLAVLEERRNNLVAQRTRSVNQLHALLRELIAGGAPPKLRADKAATLLRTVHPLTAADRARKQVAGELVAEVHGLDRQLAVINKRLHDTVTALGSRLTQTVGVGSVIAGRLLGRTGRASRFPTAAHFASYTGAAPLEVASGEHARHRLSRTGDRQLNHALHIVALVQARSPGCPGYHYFRRKLAEGKTTREALRCLKRRIADHVWRVMLADEQARDQLNLQAI
jgi:transposase